MCSHWLIGVLDEHVNMVVMIVLDSRLFFRVIL